MKTVSTCEAPFFSMRWPESPVEDGGFVTSDCRQDVRLKPLGGLIVSYCGLVVAPLGGAVCGVLCHFDMDRWEVKPCELAFLRAVAPLLLDYAIYSSAQAQRCSRGGACAWPRELPGISKAGVHARFGHRAETLPSRIEGRQLVNKTRID